MTWRGRKKREERWQPLGLLNMLDLELCPKETKILAPRNYRYRKCYFLRLECDSRRVLLGIALGIGFSLCMRPLKCS